MTAAVQLQLRLSMHSTSTALSQQLSLWLAGAKTCAAPCRLDLGVHSKDIVDCVDPQGLRCSKQSGLLGHLPNEPDWWSSPHARVLVAPGPERAAPLQAIGRTCSKLERAVVRPAP